METKKQKSNIDQPVVRRSFSVGDLVVYKPYENCRHQDISNYGKVLEDLGNGDYKVTFGYKSIHGLRTGKYNYSNLWMYKITPNVKALAMLP